MHELAAAVPSHRLPVGIDAARLAELVFAREAEITTELGNGVAIPHPDPLLLVLQT